MTWSELLCSHFAARSRRVPQARKGPARKSLYMRRARYAPAPRERYLCGAWREFYGCLNPAALVGIYGYSGYAPSKFAVRGLAEVLRVELGECGIAVTLARPPDTNTPQLEVETKLRPRPTKEIAGVAGVWDPDKVALAIVTGARKGRFIVAPGMQLRLLSSVHSMIAPAFRIYQRWVISRCRSVI
jgi:NAD(P)-dependent dehydrogenase (short-subunit alcohol dehydrogenase family)